MNETAKKKHRPTTKGTGEWPFGIFMALSFAGLILAESALLAFEDLPLLAKYALALVHIPFTVFAAASGWRFLKSMDELQRLIHIQTFIIAITGAAGALLSYSLLTSAGLVEGKKVWMFWPLLWVFYSVGYAFVSKKY